MIAHVDRGLEDTPRGSTETTKEWGSQNRRGNDHGEITKNHTFIEDGLDKVKTTEQSPQTEPIQVERKPVKRRT